MSVVFALATLFGALSGVAGYAISFRGELPVGATQTALAAAFVGAAMLARFLVRALRRAAIACDPRPRCGGGPSQDAPCERRVGVSAASAFQIPPSTASAPRTEPA